MAGAAIQRFKIVFFVPPAALTACKDAIFGAGAGRFPGPAGYSECCFTTRGTGQFRPGDKANPHVSSSLERHSSWTSIDYLQIGKVGKLEVVDEFRVEAICLGKDIAVKAIVALKK